MNVYFRETGSTVLIQNDKNKVRTEFNRDNIEGILLLENDKERIEKQISDLESKSVNYKKNVKQSYLKNHRSFVSAVVGVVLASAVGKAIIGYTAPGLSGLISTSIPNSPFGLLASIFMLYSKEKSYHKFMTEKEVMDKEKQECDSKIKNLNILKFSVNYKMKLEKNANLTANRVGKTKPIYNKGLVDFSILDYYEKNHDELLDYYKKHKDVPFYKDEFHSQILSGMVQKELHDEKEAINNISLKDKVKSKLDIKDKVKTKVKEKVNNFLK